ncbi:myeloid leukemia factor isoform X2 [Lutzomyia longipalpis]|uniref:myeloid leukemia factor isoform X2 n=1 Tax=Lutzomyia longipalpis TaxID=7200 RepID=UPI002483B17A|nr:myeloid leukemia factor isoform X2 [Lutzomyia longipalpis]
MFGSSMLNDFDEDPFFGHHLRSMRQMSNMMNSLLSDPFGMFGGFDAIGGGAPALMGPSQTALTPFGFPNINRLLATPGGFMEHPGMQSYSSSSYVSMTSGPDGRPHVYQASSSTKTGPGGLRETQKTVQDSRTGIKKMAIGHHIGDRAHVIEREQNAHAGTQEERQDFINLDEDEAEDFDREFITKSRSMLAVRSPQSTGQNSRELLALPAPPTRASQSSSAIAGARDGDAVSSRHRRPRTTQPIASPRRPLRTPTSSPLALTASSTRNRRNLSSTSSSILSKYSHRLRDY